MKHHNFTALAAAGILAALAACSKTAQEEQADTLHPVRFNVSALAAEYGPLTKADGDTPEIKALSYVICKENGTRYSKKDYTAAELAALDLSALEIPLPSGNLKAHFWACTDNDTPLVHIDNYSFDNCYQPGEREIFGGHISVNIGTAETYPAELNRVNGGLALNLTDLANAPANFTKITIRGNFPRYLSATEDCSTKESETRTLELTKAQIVAGEYLPVLPFGAQSLTVAVYCNNQYKSSYTVNAAVYQNRKTIITGAVFGGAATFAVTVEDTWGDDNPVNIQ